MLHNVQLAYGNREILHNVNLDLRPGQLVALMGPNGSGKSTLLNAIHGEMKLSRGSISLQEKALNEHSIKQLSERISIVQTNLPELGYMRVYEFIALGRYPYTSWSGRLSADDIQVIDRTISNMGIESLSDRFVHELSDGERQKTVISRALVQDTAIILMDEPTAFIDPVASLEILELLKRQTTEFQKSIVFSSHDIGSAFQFADAVWLIGKDGVVESGTAIELAEKGSIESAFGRPGFRLSKSVTGFKVGSKL